MLRRTKRPFLSTSFELLRTTPPGTSGKTSAHVVTAPLSVADCLLTAQWSVHLAETLQTPVIMLSDQSLGQTRVVIDRPENIAGVVQIKVTLETRNPLASAALAIAGVTRKQQIFEPRPAPGFASVL